MARQRSLLLLGAGCLQTALKHHLVPLAESAVSAWSFSKEREQVRHMERCDGLGSCWHHRSCHKSLFSGLSGS